MHSDVQLSTRFLTAQNQHQLRMLVTVGGDAPVERPAINVALVLDRSGSMSGMPLEEAKQAALRFSEFLSTTELAPALRREPPKSPAQAYNGLGDKVGFTSPPRADL